MRKYIPRTRIKPLDKAAKSRIKQFKMAIEYMKQGEYEKAKQIFLKNLEDYRGNEFALFYMGKIMLIESRGLDRNSILYKEKINEAEQYFLECIKQFPTSVGPRIELSDLYISQKKEVEAERLLLSCINLPLQKQSAGLRLAELYEKQGKLDQANKMYLYCISKDPQDNVARPALEGLYRTKKAGEGLTEIEKNIISIMHDNGAINRLERGNHIKRHTNDDLTKDLHGIFLEPYTYKEVLNMVNNFLRNKGNEKKLVIKGCDMYCIRVEGCGYMGGKMGDGKILDNITIVTLSNSNKVITAYPSRDIFAIEEPTKVLCPSNVLKVEEDDYER
ncbi:MAG: tetratricopeptide repeat protein [Oscillospiraceae bacterium]|nr:tetratricopeptide repeat protein [Oscillospiraceae bacterium]